MSAAAAALLLAAASISSAGGGSQHRASEGEEGAGSSPLSFQRQIANFFTGLATPERKSRSFGLSSSYDPDFNISSILVSAAALYDHGYLWDRVSSGNTVFKLEASAGSMVRPELRGVASANLLGVYYPRTNLETVRPYLEAGIGVIYADYRVDDQAFRFNFNPQLGIGMEFMGSGGSWFFAARLNHVSNGGIHDDNNGVNSLLLQIGQYF